MPFTPPPVCSLPGRLRFLGPLPDLVATVLHRPSFEALVDGTGGVPYPRIDRAYLIKILNEEISRAFGHPLRPLVELVLNAVDAAGGARSVDITVADHRVEVADQGEGMSLRTILSRLLLPFATDRVPGVHLGRFGVGFFSVLGMGLSDSPSFSLDVNTGDGASGHLLHATARGKDASSILVSLYETAPTHGTRIRVGSALLEANGTRAYLVDALHFFPHERAVVRIGGTAINDGSLVAGGRSFQEEAAPGLTARFHLGGRGRTSTITSATYHEGVKVQSCFAVGELALLDFPGAVEITEGRDALKPGPAFHAVAATILRRLARLGAEADTTASARLRLADTAAQISALMLQGAAFAEVAVELARALLGPERYLVGIERAEALIGFLGAAVERHLFVPEGFWAARQWSAHLPGERELLDRALTLGPVQSLAALAIKRPDLAGLRLLADRAANPDVVPVALALGRGPPGVMPCLGTRSAVLLRADADALRQPRGWADLYALRTSFDRALGMREGDVERDLIVATPIGLSRVAPV